MLLLQITLVLKERQFFIEDIEQGLLTTTTEDKILLPGNKKT
jgi:hypothetical protein